MKNVLKFFKLTAILAIIIILAIAILLLPIFLGEVFSYWWYCLYILHVSMFLAGDLMMKQQKL